MASDFQTYPILLVSLLLQLAGLVFAVLADPYVKRTHRIVMMMIVGAVLLLIGQDYAESLLELVYAVPSLRLLVSIAGYIIRPVIIVLFFYIVKEDRDYNFGWTLVAINAVVYLSALFTDIVFTIDASNTFRRGPLGFTCHIISAILLLQLLWISIREYGRIHKSNIIPIFNTLLIVGAVAADGFAYIEYVPVSWLTVCIVSCCVFYYIWLHLQFVYDYESQVQTEQRIQIMMSQIQPHFLFNTLSTIQSLCRIDPVKASDTVEKFGIYLRQNLESLDQTDLIPFEKELEHVKLYADIEMIRFPFITVEYFIEDRDFCLPTLSVQPLVENAIRHGVRIREDGLVTIRSWKDIDAHIITITDNGIGFDINAPEQKDRKHIGIRNVRERLEKMCGGTLTINSTIGEGTSVVISIPGGKETS